MKKSILFGATLAIAGLAIAPVNAQTQSTSTTKTTTTNYMPTSTVIGSAVRSSNGEEIGTIKDVVLDKNTGCMAYTVLSTHGTGTHTAVKTVAVPWTVFTPGSEARTYTVQVDRERIYNAPVWEASRVDEYSRTDYLTNVYGYYGVPAPRFGADINVGVGSGTTGVSTGTSTGFGASTNASAAPMASVSPTASISASPSASLRPAASPTVSASVKPLPSMTISPSPTVSSKPSASASVAASSSSSATKSASATHTPASRKSTTGAAKTETSDTTASETKSETATESGSSKGKKSSHHHPGEGSASPEASASPNEP